MKLVINQEVPDIISRAGRTLQLVNIETSGSIYNYIVFYSILGQVETYPCTLRQWLIWGGVLDA